MTMASNQVWSLRSNGSKIPVLTELTGLMKGVEIQIWGIIMEHVDEVIHGMPWLKKHGAFLTFLTGKIIINGKDYPMLDKECRSCCRWVGPVQIILFLQGVKSTLLLMSYTPIWEFSRN